MTDRRATDAWKRFIEGWERSVRDRTYHRHPDRTQLTHYLQSSSPSADDVPLSSERPDEIRLWLEGASGWSTPTISLHVLTCSICRKRIQLIREEQMATTVEPSIAWWKRAVDVITNVIVSPRVRWVATVGIVGLVFFSLTMSLIPQAPPDGNEPPPLPIKRDNPPMGGIG